MLIPRNLRGALTRESPIAANVIAFSGAQDHIKLPLNEDSAHSAHLALQAYYESLTFETGTMVEPSRQTIDHGRVETLKRREKFATLSVELHLPYGQPTTTIVVPNRAILSERRIYRLGKAQGFNFNHWLGAAFVGMIYALMCDWRTAGYPPLDDEAFLPFTGKVGAWTVKLVQS